MSLSVREYQTVDGEIPFRQWLATLDRSVRARIQARVLRFEAGNLGDHKGVGAGVLEARIMTGAGYRIYFGRDGASLVLLLAGGMKASQARDMRRAQDYWCDYLERGVMARRSRDWNEGLARDLRDPDFARDFLLAAMDEGVPIQTALGKVIRAIGVKEFAEQAQMAGPNVLRAINLRHNPTQATLNRLLKPLRLRLSLARLDGPGSRHAA